jgi:hypothetical protein
VQVQDQHYRPATAGCVSLGQAGCQISSTTAVTAATIAATATAATAASRLGFRQCPWGQDARPVELVLAWAIGIADLRLTAAAQVLHSHALAAAGKEVQEKGFVVLR